MGLHYRVWNAVSRQVMITSATCVDDVRKLARVVWVPYFCLIGFRV